MKKGKKLETKKNTNDPRVIYLPGDQRYSGGTYGSLMNMTGKERADRVLPGKLPGAQKPETPQNRYAAGLEEALRQKNGIPAVEPVIGDAYGPVYNNQPVSQEDKWKNPGNQENRDPNDKTIYPMPGENGRPSNVTTPDQAIKPGGTGGKFSWSGSSGSTSYTPGPAGPVQKPAENPGGGKMPEHDNKYLAMMDEILARLNGEYDISNDPMALAYKKDYLRNEARAREDTMGTYAGMTGGLPSSAAVAAAAEQGNLYRAQLNSELEKLREKRFDQDAQRAQLAMTASENEENRYQRAITNAMNRWTTTGVADEGVAAVLGVPVGATTMSKEYQDWNMAFQEKELASREAYQNAQLSLQEQDMEWKHSQADLDRQWRQDQAQRQQAMDIWKTTGVADENVSAVLGVPVGTTTASRDYNDWQRTMAEEDRAWKQDQTEKQQAMQIWTTTGVADENVAATLGVPVGTTTQSREYQDWQKNMAENDRTWKQDQAEQQQAMQRWSQMGVADEYVSSVLGVPVGTPTASQDYNNWQRSMTEEKTARETAMAIISTGKMPSQEQLDAAGISAEDAQSMVDSAIAANQPHYGGGGGGGGKKSNGKDLKWSEYQELLGMKIAADSGDAAAKKQFDAYTSYLASSGYDIDKIFAWLYANSGNGGGNKTSPGAPIGGNHGRVNSMY